MFPLYISKNLTWHDDRGLLSRWKGAKLQTKVKGSKLEKSDIRLAVRENPIYLNL